MTSAQVVETSVTNNSSFQNYSHPDDHTIRTTDTPGFKPFTVYFAVQGGSNVKVCGNPAKESIGYCFHLTQRGTKIRRGLVHVSTLNPKCVTVGELYGEVNPTTMEWTDGLLSHIYRKYAKTSRGTIQGARRKQSNTPLPASPSRLSRGSSAKSVVTSVSAISLEDSNERENLYGLFILW